MLNPVFHSALNAPWLLIVLYLLPLVTTCLLLARQFKYWSHYTSTEVIFIAVAALINGAGLALLGAAYLHDVWYC